MSSLRLCCQITYKDKIRDINVLRANKGLKPVRKANTAGSIYARWYLVYQDLLIIIECQVALNKKRPRSTSWYA